MAAFTVAPVWSTSPVNSPLTNARLPYSATDTTSSAYPALAGSAGVPHDGTAVDEKVLAGVADGGAVVGGPAGPEGGVVGGPGGKAGAPDARAGLGKAARPTMGLVRLPPTLPRSAASPKARSSPEVAACQ